MRPRTHYRCAVHAPDSRSDSHRKFIFGKNEGRGHWATQSSVANFLEGPIIYIHRGCTFYCLLGQHANSAFHPFGVDKLSSEQLYRMCAGRAIWWVFTRFSRCGYQPLCAVCGSILAELNPSVYSAALRGGCCFCRLCECALCRQLNKRTLSLLELQGMADTVVYGRL